MGFFVLQLRRNLDIEGNPNIGAVKLPKKGETYEGKKAIVSGFGLNKVDVIVNPFSGEYDEVNGRRYNKMRYAKAEVMSYDDCQDIFGAVLPIDKTHLCAALVQHDEYQPEGVCSVSYFSYSVYFFFLLILVIDIKIFFISFVG